MVGLFYARLTAETCTRGAHEFYGYSTLNYQLDVKGRRFFNNAFPKMEYFEYLKLTIDDNNLSETRSNGLGPYRHAGEHSYCATSFVGVLSCFLETVIHNKTNPMLH